MLGQEELAWDRTRESLVLAQELGERTLILDLIADMAALAMETGEAKRAARLEGAEAMLRASLAIPLPPVERAGREETLARIREALRAQEFAYAWERGQALSLEEAVAYAVEQSG
jgi:hypothetical protein